MRSRKPSPGLAVTRILISSREHARAAGDGAAVAAAFADDRRGLAGDGGFVHGGRAFDDFAVGGDDFRGAHDHDIAFAQRIGGHDFIRSPEFYWRWSRVRACAKRLGLGLAAAFGDGFGEVGEQDGEPEPEGDLRDEPRSGRASGKCPRW